MNKFEHMKTLERPVHFPNIDDWNSSFWKNDYIIFLTRFGIPFAVNADNEQEAIDYVIDYCEDHNMPGLLWDESEIDEMEQEGVLEDYICGGNHSRYLSTYNVLIETI